MFNTKTRKQFNEIVYTYNISAPILSAFFGVSQHTIDSWVLKFKNIPTKQYRNIGNLHYVLGQTYEALAVLNSNINYPKSMVQVWLETPIKTKSDITVCPHMVLENTDWQNAAKYLQELIIRQTSNLEYYTLLNTVLPSWNATKTLT